jgi:signal transduction histidine kinase
MAIPDQIKQILLNLFHNAMDACWQSGGGLIEITTSHEEERITIAIKDSGLGIKAEEIDHIFEPFYTTKSVVGKGIGLGLSVCQEIVRNHQGEIRVESRPGEGATFAVLLPVFQK